MNALLRKDDEVIVLSPCYQQLSSTAQRIGCELKRWNLRFENDFRPDVEELKSLITPRTRMIILNFPHNPTGASLSYDERQRVSEMASLVNAYLIWDNAFAELTYDGVTKVDAGIHYENAIEIGTLSKTYGLPGLRVGWCIAQRAVLKECVRIRDYVTLHLSPLVESIAERVVDRADILLEIRLAQVRTNLTILSDWAEMNRDRVQWVRPRGGVTVFPQLPFVDDVEALCRRLAELDRVLLVPGTCFDVPAHIRLGFGGATRDLRQGLSRLSEALA
jgi:aspartate/methionine/tyrosine aminotransferase